MKKPVSEMTDEEIIAEMSQLRDRREKARERAVQARGNKGGGGGRKGGGAVDPRLLEALEALEDD